jgi:hypothetical protein
MVNTAAVTYLIPSDMAELPQRLGAPDPAATVSAAAMNIAASHQLCQMP